MESYLKLYQSSTMSVTTSNTVGEEKIKTAFVTPYKPTTTDPLQEAQTALKPCQQNQSLLSSDEIFVMQLLQVQLSLALEDAHIQAESQHAYQQAQNRAAETTTSTTTNNTKGGKSKSKPSVSSKQPTGPPPSLESIRQSKRRQVLIAGDLALEEAVAGAFRDVYLERCRSNYSDNNHTPLSQRELSAAAVLTQILGRYRERAKALACHRHASKATTKDDLNAAVKGWIELAQYLHPIWNDTLTQLVGVKGNENDKKEEEESALLKVLQSKPSQELQLIETSLTLAPCVQWMVSSSSSTTTQNDIIPDNLLEPMEKVLAALVDRALQIKREYQAASNVLKTSTEPMDIHIRQLECAKTSVHSLILLQQQGNTATISSKLDDRLKAHSELAVRMAQYSSKYSSASAEYGTGFYNFALAWSGLSHSPWSFCTAPEARLIWKHAQQCLSQASNHKSNNKNTTEEWGRPVAPIEQILLDLGQADAECGILSSGLPAVASKVYQDIMDQVQNPSTEGLTTELCSLVKSHCWIGLTRMALLGNHSSDPVELTQNSILELASIDESSMAPYLWVAASAMEVFVKFHMTMSRQLVADALVRSGRSSEAKIFLEDAVRDSPKDAEAAFALGAFLLREALQSPDRSPTHLNGAKMQLLHAAKLNSRKAGPFALLGVFYEIQKDLKRALGCYSKALLLDPPHPVAGRGVLRLTSWNSVKAVVDNAIQTSSAVNGWAWRGELLSAGFLFPLLLSLFSLICR